MARRLRMRIGLALRGGSASVFGDAVLEECVDFREDGMRFAERADANASAVTGSNSTTNRTSTIAIPSSTASTLVVSNAGSKPVVSFVALMAGAFFSVPRAL